MTNPAPPDPFDSQDPLACLLDAFSGFITQTTGLLFGAQKRMDLRRAIKGIAQDLGYSDHADCIVSLMRDPLTPQRLASLARHLTVPETYFLRDKASLDTVASHVLPQLIQARRETTRRIRAWSVACCTGEEAYSIAITLARAIPDWQQWDISVLATDINPASLAKGRQATFSEWSFRSAPSWLKTQYLHPVATDKPGATTHWQVIPEISELIRFEPLNLAQDHYPGFARDMDLIFCANVLMYFSDAQAVAAVEKLSRMQSDAGWLIIGPNDVPSALPGCYLPISFDHGTLYRKTPFDGQEVALAARPVSLVPSPPPIPRAPDPIPVPPAPVAARPAAPNAPATTDPGQEARSLADQGKLREALIACDIWVSRDKSNPAGHYLRAVILIETGNPSQAAKDLRKATYLNPEFVMAHFTAGNLALSSGDLPQARKHMANVVRLLAQAPGHSIVPESAGMTVERLAQLASQHLTSEARR